MPRRRPSYSRFRFQGKSGYILTPAFLGGAFERVSVRHSSSAPPWADADIHLHCESEEYYFLFQGELCLLIGPVVLTLRPREVLMVRANVPHAVVGGSGPIEHFVVRVPALDDRQIVGRVPLGLSAVSNQAQRELASDWGCRVPLTEEKYQNCWLFGTGRAYFHSDPMCLAYLSFPTDESLNEDRHPHRLHLHRESWEYYAVIRGTRILEVEKELVQIDVGELLEVPPRIKHALRSTLTPFEGFTFRVPLLDDKVEF